MAPSGIEAKLLDNPAVMCQAGGCDRPAAWLLASRDGEICTAQCDAHALEFAQANGAVLPNSQSSR